MIEALIALVALALMEIVLGIDNIVFISVATSKLPAEQQSSGRKLGLLLALGTRILLLCGIFWIAQLVTPVFTLSDTLPIEGLKTHFTEHGGRTSHGDGTAVADKSPPAEAPKLDQWAWDEFNEVSWRDIILILGGLFLIYSSVHEIHEQVDHSGSKNKETHLEKQPSYSGILIRIAVMDVIFSLDSVITAVGMAKELWVMVTAVVLAVGVMIWFANQVGDFVDKNPTIKMMAISFLLLIGVMLVAEGIGTPISKGYIYFAMAFALFVESFNLRIRRNETAHARP